jgi:hypothetical protein
MTKSTGIKAVMSESTLPDRKHSCVKGASLELSNNLMAIDRMQLATVGMVN